MPYTTNVPAELDNPARHEFAKEAKENAQFGESRSPYINVSQNERVVSAVGGGILALYGLTRGGWLGVGLAALGGGLLYRGATGHCDTYNALGISTAEKQNPYVSVKGNAGIKVEKAVTINATPETLYNFWRRFENLPQFMDHLESVQQTDEKTSHWKAKAPLGSSVEWDAEIINDEPNRLIAWRSLEGADVDNSGSVRFEEATGGRGTVVKVSLKYDPPAGKLGAAVAWLFGEEPTVQVEEDLRRFKNIMEASEIPSVQGQTSGREKGARVVATA